MSAPTPSGWYQDPSGSGQLRFWDGSTWTSQTAPAPSRPVAAATASPRRTLLIGGAIAAGVLVVGSVGAALVTAGSRDDDVLPVAVAAAEAPEAPGVDALAGEEPIVIVVDGAAFAAEAGSHIDDIDEALDDIVATVAEGGSAQLLTDDVKLRGDLAHLEGLDMPANVATTWPASLATLAASIDAYSDAVSAEDPAAILTAVDAVRAANEAARAVADSAG